MRRDGSTGDAGDEIRERLGLYRIGERRAIKAVAELVKGERLHAVGTGYWQRRGWVVVAWEGGVRLSRRPRVFGRARDERFEWADLTAVESSAASMRLMMMFGDRAVGLSMLGPPGEYARFLDTARSHLTGSDAGVTVEQIRSLARRELGRLRTLQLDASIAGLPDHLEPGERVELVAGATLLFGGVLVVTDRRVLLSGPVSVSRERVWSVARREVRSAAAVEDGLWLDLGDRALTLTQIIPGERRYELADLLASEADNDGARRSAEAAGQRSRIDGGTAPQVLFRGPLLPSLRWELTAAESYLLRFVDIEVREGAFRLSLLELLARRALRLDGARIPRRWAPGSRFAWLLADGPQLASVREPALAPVLALYARARERRPRIGRAYRDPAVEIEGVLLSDLLTGDFRILLSDLNADVAASLQRRGLLSVTHERTPAGARADRQLDKLLQLGRTELPSRADDADVSWARAYLHGAGAAILLVDAAYPALTHLGRRLAKIARTPEAPPGTPDDVGAIDFAGFDQAFASAAGLDGASGILDAAFGFGDQWFALHRAIDEEGAARGFSCRR